jgi:amino acid transporter
MLRRRLSLLQAVSLNMAMMVGIGPFITIPELVKTMYGAHALLAWIVGALVAVADGLVWSELAAAFPGSGGTYHFYDAVYASTRVGRMMKFLFVWQFLFSGPLELASGAIGFGAYAGYLWPILKSPAAVLPIGSTLKWTLPFSQCLAVGLMAGVVLLAYRRIEVAGRLMVALWVGVLATLGWMIVSGLSGLDPALAFHVPPNSLRVNSDSFISMGKALGLAMYCYFGYYQVCYLGDEVTNPAHTIPRSILISTVSIALVYVALHIAVVGVLPLSQVATSTHVGSDFMLRRHGPTAAVVITLMILWTGATGTFAGVLGYARIPFAAAQAGHFFRGLAKTNPNGDFPARSLLLVGGLSAIACLADLPTVIAALMTSRILIQFVGQIFTVFYVRKKPDLMAKMPFRMWLYPLPALIALIGWLYIFGTSGVWIMTYGLASLGAGVLAFTVWDAEIRKLEATEIRGGLE